MSLHKEIEEKVVEELQALQNSEPDLRDGKRNLVFDDLRKLPYLHAVIKVKLLACNNPTRLTKSLRRKQPLWFIDC